MTTHCPKCKRRVQLEWIRFWAWAIGAATVFALVSGLVHPIAGVALGALWLIRAQRMLGAVSSRAFVFGLTIYTVPLALIATQSIAAGIAYGVIVDAISVAMTQAMGDPLDALPEDM